MEFFQEKKRIGRRLIGVKFIGQTENEGRISIQKQGLLSMDNGKSERIGKAMKMIENNRG